MVWGGTDVVGYCKACCKGTMIPAAYVCHYTAFDGLGNNYKHHIGSSLPSPNISRAAPSPHALTVNSIKPTFLSLRSPKPRVRVVWVVEKIEKMR